MRMILVFGAALVAIAMPATPSRVQASCTVNVGWCRSGDCLVNVGTCSDGGRCKITVGECSDGESDLVAL